MNVALSCQRAFLGRHARAPSVATAAIAETAASEYADVAVKNSGWLVAFDMVVTGLPLISVQLGKKRVLIVDNVAVVAVGDAEERCSSCISQARAKK